MARPAIPGQLVAGQMKRSLACPHRRTPCMAGVGGCQQAQLGQMGVLWKYVPDVDARFLPHHLGASSTTQVRPVRRPACRDRTNLSPVGQPAHHTGHSKKDREKVKGETLPAGYKLDITPWLSATYPLRDRSDRYMLKG